MNQFIIILFLVIVYLFMGKEIQKLISNKNFVYGVLSGVILCWLLRSNIEGMASGNHPCCPILRNKGDYNNVSEFASELMADHAECLNEMLGVPHDWDANAPNIRALYEDTHQDVNIDDCNVPEQEEDVVM